jgi:hypothetical protein
MSVVSVKVCGIMDLNATAEGLCPESGTVLSHLSLQETLMKYLKLHDSNPMAAELHQRGPQGLVNMVIPNSSKVEACFEMFNKQPVGYLYHVLPLFGAMRLFVKTILRWSMDAGLTTEAPLCTYNEETKILTTPCDAPQESILSNVCTLPFFEDIHAIKQAADANMKGRKKEYTAPKMCFQIGNACSIETVHGANDGKYSKVTKPGIKLGTGTQASAANLNAKKLVIKIASENDASSSEGSGESSDASSCSDNCLHCSLVRRKSNLRNWPAADSPLQLPPPPPASTTGGAEQTKMSSGECEVAGLEKRRRDQQCACCFRNLGESTPQD